MTEGYLILLLAVSAIHALVLAMPFSSSFRYRLGWSGGLLLLALTLWLDLTLPIEANPSGQGPWLQFDEWARPILPAVTASATAMLGFLKGEQNDRKRSMIGWSLFALFSSALTAQPILWATIFSVSWLPLLLMFDARGSQGARRLIIIVHVGSAVLFGGALTYLTMGGESTHAALLLAMGALLARGGLFPFHSWVPVAFSHGSPLCASFVLFSQISTIGFGRWILDAHGEIASEFWHINSTMAIITAVYAALVGCVQRDGRRYLGWIALSQTALTVVGLVDAQTHEFSAGHLVWIVSILALSAISIIFSALRSRIGQLRLDGHHGLFEKTPILASLYLFFSMSLIGLFGSLGFVSEDLMVHGGLQVRVFVGIGIAAVSALNGYSLFRAYSSVFLGPPRSEHDAVVDALPRERWALVGLLVLMLGGGLFPGKVVRGLLELY